MPERRAVFFDVDGTLVDTHEYVFGGIEYSAGLLGYPIPTRQQIKEIVANPIRICYEQLFPDGDVERCLLSHGEFQNNNPHLVKLFPDTLEVLSEIKARRLAIAAVTSRRTAGSRRMLKSVGVEGFFGLIVGADDVVKPKPDPEGINMAVSYLGVNRSLSYMVGDTKPDILAGRAAGVTTIGVTYGFDGEDIRRAQPSYTTNSLKQILEII